MCESYAKKQNLKNLTKLKSLERLYAKVEEIIKAISIKLETESLLTFKHALSFIKPCSALL